MNNFPKLNNTFGKLPKMSNNLFKLKGKSLKIPKIKTLAKPKSMFTDFNNFTTNNIGDTLKDITKIGVLGEFIGLQKRALSTKLLARSAVRANRLGNIKRLSGKAISPDVFAKTLKKKQQAQKFITHAWASKGSRRGIGRLTFFRDQVAPGALKRIKRLK